MPATIARLPRPVAFTDFLRDVDAGRVATVTVTTEGLLFERRDELLVTVAPQGYIASNPTFVSGLAQRGIRLDASGAVVQCWAVWRRRGGFLLFGMAGLVLVRMMIGRVPTLMH